MAGDIAAFVFDLDGLLIDSEPLQIAAWERYLAQFGAVLTPDVLAGMYGLRLVDSAIVVVEALDLPVRPADVVRDRDALFMASVPGAVQAMPGARELIGVVRASEMRVALATSGHQGYVELALESAGLAGLFDVEVTGDLVERGKPAPDTYLRVARLLELDPAQCLAFEDAPNGVRSAVAAGMRCIAVPNHGTAALEFSGALAIVDSLEQVLPLLRDLGMWPEDDDRRAYASSQG